MSNEKEEATVPTVHQALIQVGKAVGSIAKSLVNGDSRYNARGIDDVLAAFHQPLLDAGVFVRPQHRFIEGRYGETTRDNRTSVTRTVTLESTFTFVGPAGDETSITAVGEASDTSDKAANQAMQAAMKYAFLQAFVVPTGDVDADSKTHTWSENPPPNAAQTTPPGVRATAPTVRSSEGDASGPITTGQSRNLYRLWHHTLHLDKIDYLEQILIATGLEITDDRQLSSKDAGRVISHLKELAGEENDTRTFDPAPPPPYSTFEEPF